MKKVFILLTITALCFASCSKKDEVEKKDKKNDHAMVFIKTYVENSISGGLKDSIPQRCIFHIWKADSSNYTIKDADYGVDGVATNEATSENVKSDYKWVGTHYNLTLKNGRYFLCVVMDPLDYDDNSYQIGAYSYTYFKVDGKIKILKKAFSEDASFITYEKW